MRYGDFEYEKIEYGLKITRFYGSESEVKIPKYIEELPVREISESAFLGCSSLTNIIIPNSVYKIDEYAFSRCKSLTNITIPNSVYKIGRYAFSFCDELTNIIIPVSATDIGRYVFYKCHLLTKIKVSCIRKNLPSLQFFFDEYDDKIEYYNEKVASIKNLVALLNSLSAVSKVDWN